MRHLDPSEFRDVGYLQELNRRFLHPLGLALAVTIDDDGTAELGPIWDCRDDDEGIVYEGDLPDAGKAARVTAEMAARAPARIEALGFFVQPMPGERPGEQTTYEGDPK